MNGFNNNANRHLKDLSRLTDLSEELRQYLENAAPENIAKPKKHTGSTAFAKTYQLWYSETCLFVSQVLPARLPEFETLYHGDPKRKGIYAETYAIRDFLLGLQLSPQKSSGVKENDIVRNRFDMQCTILESAKALFETSLGDVGHLLKKDSSDMQLGSQRELQHQAFLKGIHAAINVMTNILHPELLDNPGRYKIVGLSIVHEQDNED